MDSMCGSILNLAKVQNYSAALTFLRSPSIIRRSCDIAIDSGRGSPWTGEVSWNRLLFQFLDFRNPGDSCVSFRQSDDRAHWDHASKTIKGLGGTYCQGSLPPLNKPFVTDKYHFLVIKFQAENYLDEQPVTFKLVVNVLHSGGSCSQYECDNGNCIPKSLRCGLYNPCGDKSHCRPEGVSVQTIIFIVIGVSAGLLFLFLVIKYIRFRKGSDDDDYSTGNGNTTSMTTNTENRPDNQTPTAPRLLDENEADLEHIVMLPANEMPPPSYEEVMAQEK